MPELFSLNTNQITSLPCPKPSLTSSHHTEKKSKIPRNLASANFAHYSQTRLTSLLFLQQTKLTPTSGLLYWLFALSGMFCLQIVTQCAVLSFSSVCSNIFFSVRSALISLSKTTHLTILSTFYPPQYYHYSIHRNAILIYFSSSKLHLFKKSQILRMWVVA